MEFKYKITGRCTYCATCIEVCKFDAINMKDNSFFIDQEVCQRCGECYKNCPSEAIDRTPLKKKGEHSEK